ncbi:alkaline phosphatase family protein [bacterium]|nr:alkaline phosphatase family protein [bacterium]
MNAIQSKRQLQTLVPIAFWGAVFCLLAACATGGATRYQSFLQAVELAKIGQGDAGREAIDAACDSGSAAACDARGGRERPSSPVPILQTATTDEATEIVVLLPGGENKTQIFLWDTAKRRLITPLNVATFPIPDGLGTLLHLRYEGLERVPMRLQLVSPAGELLDARDLTTLETSKRQAVLAVASCMDNRHPLHNSIWEELLSHDPDALFLIGDTVYTDVSEDPGVSERVPVTPQVLWQRYTHTRQQLSLFYAPKLVPTFAVWDDHDYGQNDGDRRFEYKDTVRQVFQAFFGTADFPGVYDHGPGVSSRLNAFGQRFFFLDNRSFRDPAGEKEGTHFGVDQESWLFTDLFGDLPSWLISGDQFFGGYHAFESYEGRHPGSFAKFTSRLRNTSPVIFLSGDRHLAEIMGIPQDVLGFATYEITTSPIHSTVYSDPWKDTPNPRQIQGIAGVNNYAILETDASEGLVVGVRVYGPDSRRLLARRLEVRR